MTETLNKNIVAVVCDRAGYCKATLQNGSYWLFVKQEKESDRT